MLKLNCKQKVIRNALKMFFNLQINILPERFECCDVLVTAGPQMFPQNLVQADRAFGARLTT